ncbi:type VI secretion system-associated protein TagF [Pseudophaeobacter sp.]|uniref:type VI secretion system-associated protein TagF n=1 Tax=Pseudophaeobacter sp. TaxID=1971739 RepID=UPI003297EFBF
MESGFGAYGKMPAVGDFFRINAGGSFVRIWDAWLQNLLLEGQTNYGPQFDALYMSAPIWRFTLAGGQAGPAKMMGVLMPSVDRVGRRFPLTLMLPLTTPGPPALDHFRETALFEQLEEIALSALEDDMTRERLAAGLARLEPPGLRASAPLRQQGTSYVLTGTGTGADGAAVQTYLAAALLAKQAPGAGLWTAVLDSGPRLMVSPELPLGQQGSGLLDMSAPIWREAQPV